MLEIKKKKKMKKFVNSRKGFLQNQKKNERKTGCEALRHMHVVPRKKKKLLTINQHSNISYNNFFSLSIFGEKPHATHSQQQIHSHKAIFQSEVETKLFCRFVLCQLIVSDRSVNTWKIYNRRKLRRKAIACRGGL